ncbi:MAG: 16S rRNA (cytosine(967)-C(5))-methyltransferase RsmB [Candidatus Alcyoniella australis]|nr:16S rRNA (cytosine(967)-C(5))-methyltransferase RsmB [Candidatus Alcyoniella australis]
MADPARQTAMAVLSRTERQHAYASVVLDAQLRKQKLSSSDRALATELVYGCLRHAIRLDETALRLADGRKLDPLSLRLLRLGLYQLAFLRIPEHAAVHASVGLAPPERRGLINALLRRFIREGRRLAEPVPGDGAARGLSLLYSHPLWMVERMLARYDEQTVEQALDALNANLGVHLRAEVEPEELIAALAREGHTARAGRLASRAVRLDRFSLLGRDQLFREGRYTPQDEASQTVIELCGAQPGQKVLDLCAAPGNKTTGLARAVGPEGRVTALDLHPTRLGRVPEEARRLGLFNIESRVADATNRRELDRALKDRGEFDLVLVDAPCSALGTLAHSPELKARRVPADIERLAALQLELLQSAVARTAHGGTLVYSVCTLTPEENAGVVAKLLEACPELEPQAFDALGTDWDKIKSAPHEVEILPQLFGTEGFYVARFVRR